MVVRRKALIVATLILLGLLLLLIPSVPIGPTFRLVVKILIAVMIVLGLILERLKMLSWDE